MIEVRVFLTDAQEADIASSIRFMLDEIDSGRLPINDDQPVTTVVDELVP